MAGHDYPVNLMINLVINLSVQIEREVLISKKGVRGAI